MNHQDCIATLLGSAKTAGAPEQQEARDHAGRCSDCGAVLALLHELAMESRPPTRRAWRAYSDARPYRTGCIS